MSEENKPEEPGTETQAQASAETNPENNTQEAAETPSNTVALNGMFGFKVGMATVFSEEGVQVPVTVLKVKPWTVTQVKNKDTDKYDAVQISLLEKAEKNTGKAEMGHLKAVGGKNGARFTREIRQALPEGVRVGQEVDVTCFEKGQKLRLTAKSKGRGFAGTVKRYNFGGGPASHGSTFHRQPGSIGNCTFPGRVMPGRKMPGHFGNETVTIKNVEVVDVQADQGLILVKGPVPGARNGLVQMLKQG